MDQALIISRHAETGCAIKDAISAEFNVEQADTTEEALAKQAGKAFDLIFVDLENDDGQHLAKAMDTFKNVHASMEYVVLAAKSEIRKAVRAVKAGAGDYITCPVEPEEIRLVVSAYREARAKEHELAYLRNRFWKTEWLDVIHTRSPLMAGIYESIQSVAQTIATVLLMGETGTGKGLLARLIHIHSRRNTKPFLSVHCGAIPDTLLESELFGYEKGAFTDAVKRKAGKFQMAEGGTIFLDEIGTISTSAQIKLLQILQDKTYSRVGGEELLKSDVRIIAATNADLKQLVTEGRFRKDLYYRLNVFPIEIPPLRDRTEDIPHLIDVFLQKLNQQYGKRILQLYPGISEALTKYNWPGNIRELENVLERAYIIEQADILRPQSFPAEIISPEAVSTVLQECGPLSLNEARHLAIEEFERMYIKNLIARNKGRVNRSAEEAKITPRQLNRLMSRYGIKKSEYKG